ncbi:MAG TPA: sugar phosphate isomerase/epimerase family protein [Solirubrobacteraceae bacterium]|nr:sugar phosphate isomerase/epimerase family protein [Solirubrobacteraceae bacterium]
MILAIQENLVPGETVADRLAFALDAGFDGLELRDAARPGLEAVRGRAPTACPELDGWLGDFDAAARRRALEGLRRQLDGIAALGGLGVITPAAWGMFTRRLPPFDEPPRTPEQDREVLLEGLAELGAHAGAAGVALLLEPLNRYEDHMVNTVAAAAELAEASGSPAVRVLADTYHMNVEEDDPCAALRAAAGRLGAVHLSDSGRHQPGTGHVPFAAILATLREIGFAGVLSVECRLRGEPAQAVRQCGAYLRAIT